MHSSSETKHIHGFAFSHQTQHLQALVPILKIYRLGLLHILKNLVGGITIHSLYALPSTSIHSSSQHKAREVVCTNSISNNFP